ncbi:MAG: nicotinamide riboside transporter PnuC [Bacteroidales bacterium]|nr:nicotinamide riboside transporter PnuC [Bacteroidales bacterium]
MAVSDWLSNNYIEVFGAIAGIVYVFLEIRQSIWLWPVGIITSAVYILVFFTSKFYADMSLQGYYLLISCLGWYWWLKGTTAQRLNGPKEESTFAKASVDEEGERGRLGDTEIERLRDKENGGLTVTRLKLRTGVILAAVFVALYFVMWFVLSRFTDSPVSGWDSFITSLSIVATWMLARKIYEHWYLWIVVNSVSAVLFMTRGLYPTVILYVVYGIMSFVGLKAWKKSLRMVGLRHKKR